MKKILNRVEDAAMDMVRGIAAANPDVELDARYKIIKRRDIRQDRVALVSGGGSGHEPSHAGFVGKGALTAAVAGDVFASPSTMQIYNAILQTRTEKGTLLIIKNYSGDCMNFDSAAELAEDDDIEIEKVYVNDDIAVEDSLYTIGRRGVAGTLFVHKIAGAAAEAGADLSEVKRIAEKVVANVKSIGLALTSCTVPAKGTPTFSLGEDEIEFGVGIHGEPGIERRKLRDSKELAEDMVGMLLAEMNLSESDVCAVMVNGLGGTPLMELSIQYRDVHEILSAKGIGVHKAFVGNYMTSLDMAGFSVTLLKLDAETRELLDASSGAPAMTV
ncbi:MAG: dihydroxyacetone kinase subunit DhaK [Clostridiales Family XIII bacterium]|jgi:dihydroxyacetone kinase|nr:dihydroxyacetone kinase subunit DhaK [Clostridiales Family XIII bacterium]